FISAMIFGCHCSLNSSNFCRNRSICSSRDSSLIETRSAAPRLPGCDTLFIDSMRDANVNADPTPTWLLTEILPLWNSTTFRHEVSPPAYPSCFVTHGDVGGEVYATYFSVADGRQGV